MKKTILQFLTIILLNTLLQAQQQCEFPPSLGVKNFSFKTHGYTPPEYVLKDDTFGLVYLDKFGNDATRNAIQSSDFPFEALNIIAGCGNSDAMYAASLVYDDEKIKEFWTKKAGKSLKRKKYYYKAIIDYKRIFGKDNEDYKEDYKRYNKQEKEYRNFLTTIPIMYKNIKFYWLKRAIKMGNIKAIVTYYMYIEKDEQKRHTLIAKALYKIYKTNKNQYLKDMAFSELYYNKEYQKILGIDLLSYKNVKYFTLHTKVFDTGHWRNYGNFYKVDTSKDDLEFFKNESNEGIPEASTELANYYSWRDYKKTSKYLDLYKKQKFRLSAKIYPHKSKNRAYMFSKDTLINMIWNDLDEYQREYSINLNKNIKSEDKRLKDVKKLNSFYEKESKELFGINIKQLAKLHKDKKLKLIQDKVTNISKKDEKFIFEVMHHIAQWKKGKKAFIKSRNRKEKEMRELYAQLSNRSKHIVIDIAKELIKTNPKSYITKSKDKHFKTKEIMTRVQYLVLNLLETMVKIENNKYDRPTIVKKVKKFNKPKYDIKYTQNVMLLAKKIDTLAFSNSNTFGLDLKNKYKLFKENKSKIQKAIVYWLNYIVKNKNNFRKKYVNKAYYRFAQAYDERLHQRLDSIEPNKEKVFELLSEIKDWKEQSFGKYLYRNYLKPSEKDIKLFFKKAAQYSLKNKVELFDYFCFLDWRDITEKIQVKSYKPIKKEKNWQEIIEKSKRTIEKSYSPSKYNALTYYKMYATSITLDKDDFNKFRRKAMKSNFLGLLSSFIYIGYDIGSNLNKVYYGNVDFKDKFLKSDIINYCTNRKIKKDIEEIKAWDRILGTMNKLVK